MKVVLAFDSFKESMTSEEVANITANILKKNYNDIDIKIIPISDGGEGSVNAIVKAVNGNIIKYTVTGPHFEKIEVEVGNKEDDYYLEVASVVGYKYKTKEDTPSMINTVGIGEIIKLILNRNPKNIYICLGGTTSTDGGCGMATSLGVKFLNENNQEFIPIGRTMNAIRHINMDNLDKRLKDTNIYVLSDVTNPLYGDNGAAYIYGPQKGANSEEVIELDNGLKNLSNVVRNDLSFDYAYQFGCGAAGGLGYGCIVFLQAKIRRGIESILDICSFDEIIKDADYIFTGEGKLDSQSFQGKVIMGIVNRASMLDKKVIGVFGTIADNNIKLPSCVVGVYKTNYLNLPFSEAKYRVREDLAKTIEEIRLK